MEISKGKNKKLWLNIAAAMLLFIHIPIQAYDNLVDFIEDTTLSGDIRGTFITIA